MIGVIEWCVSGVVFPLVLHVATGVTPPYHQFVASLVLCGLIAAAYPFFALAVFSVRVLYPGLRPAETGCGGRRAGDRAGVADGGPLPGDGGRGAAAGRGDAGGRHGDQRGQDRTKAIALSVLGVGGFIGVLLLFPVFRVLQREVEVLKSLCASDRT